MPYNHNAHLLLQKAITSGCIAQQILVDLSQDIPSQDITSLLIDKNSNSKAKVINKEPLVLCGINWFNEAFKLVAKQFNYDNADIIWQYKDGDFIDTGKTLVELQGNSRLLLSAERIALNFLQTLSATASLSRNVSQWNLGNCKILDTRKTLPTLRLAQKYAVNIGGCKTHRLDLSDAFLIKENHIKSAGSISKAVNKAIGLGFNKKIVVEVETLKQLKEALNLPVNNIMLDNFNLADIKEAVAIKKQQNSGASLEVSGVEFTQNSLETIAQTGVDYISAGALTKNCQAIDLSMLFV